MDSSHNSGVNTEQLLALIGAKEVEIQLLSHRIALLTQQLESSARGVGKRRASKA